MKCHQPAPEISLQIHWEMLAKAALCSCVHTPASTLLLQGEMKGLVLGCAAAVLGSLMGQTLETPAEPQASPARTFPSFPGMFVSMFILLCCLSSFM